MNVTLDNKTSIAIIPAKRFFEIWIVINAVNIIHHNDQEGVTLQEDLGDNDLLAILNKDNKNELIEKSIDLLIQIQNADIGEINPFEENDWTSWKKLKYPPTKGTRVEEEEGKPHFHATPPPCLRMSSIPPRSIK